MACTHGYSPLATHSRAKVTYTGKTPADSSQSEYSCTLAGRRPFFPEARPCSGRARVTFDLCRCCLRLVVLALGYNGNQICLCGHSVYALNRPLPDLMLLHLCNIFRRGLGKLKKRSLFHMYLHFKDMRRNSPASHLSSVDQRIASINR